MLFTIPNPVGFVDALAAGLLARTPDPMALARTVVLLPNRRAVRALTEAFVRHCGGKGGLLLPRLVPVGDLDEDAFDRLAAGETVLPPAVAPLTRRLELGRLVRQRLASEALAGKPVRSAVEGLRLGSALAEALDTLLAEEIDPERLREAVADADMAHHWQETLAFLELIISAWPPERERLGMSEGGTRLTAAIAALIARWQAAPPQTPVIAAGITSTTPAIARLLKAVLALPHGEVILPGLDMAMSEAGQARWEAIVCAQGDGVRESEAHPHHALKCLLGQLGWAREEVGLWPGVATSAKLARRDEEVMAAFAPADSGEGWAAGPPDPEAAREAFENVRVLEADTPAEEAQALALALREALETPGRTAALVTPDRALARRVAAHCRRWGIMVDDSAGQPLARTPPGSLALAMVTALAEHFAPVALLALLKHPLVRRGEMRLDWLERVRQLDLALRGVRPAQGLDGVGAHIDHWLNEHPKQDRSLAAWWAEVEALLTPLERQAGETDLAALALALQTTLSALAGEAVWAGPEGRALAARLEALGLEGQVFGPFGSDEAPALLTALLADIAVRPAWGGHPRLSLLGPVEAQLMRADLMILAGLNEGVWPAPLSPDPWLAPAIRARLGLPGQARAIGTAAADFVRALGAPEVLLSRARRDASAPMLPSRFLARLDAHVARFSGETGGLGREARLLRYARGLDARQAPLSAARPAPCPPPELRPRDVSVTEVDTLIADPFAFYAKRMLRLKPLDPLDADPDAADRGQLLHGVLEQWIKGGTLDPARLASLGEAMLLSACGGFPLLVALWGPRARRALDWAGRMLLDRVAAGWQPLAAEAKGEMSLDNGIILRGRADRIDRHQDGSLSIVDYKTGQPPGVQQVREGLSNQLPLLATLAEAGAFRDGARALAAAPVSMLEYWRLSGGEKPVGEARPALGKNGNPPPVPEHVADTKVLVTAILTRTLLRPEPFVAQLQPALSWPDYDHLARVQEWRNRPSDGNDR
jgi:ATP-dependent helicase/nuclease subunit B